MAFLAFLSVTILLILFSFLSYRLYRSGSHRRPLHTHSLNPFADYISEITRASKELK